MMDRQALYTLTFPGESNPLGLAVDLHEENGALCFHDTVRPHEMVGKVHEQEDLVTLTKEDGRVFKFKLCTLAAFRRKHFKLAYNGQAIADICTSDADLWEYYRRRLREDFR